MPENERPVERKLPAEPPQPPGHLEGAAGQQGAIVVTRHLISELHTYEVTEQDLTVLRRGSFLRALLTTFMGFSFSAAVSFIIVLFTVPISDLKVYATFVAVVIVCTVIFLFSLSGWIYVEKAEIKPVRERIKKINPRQ